MASVQHVLQPTVLSAAGRWTPTAAACAVTVGNFDGVHVGHLAIVNRLLAVAHRLDVPAVVLTFDPHPASIVRPTAAPVALSTPARRAELLALLGVDAVLVQPTDRQFVTLEAEAFYAELLHARLRAVAIVEGNDFRFGANRKGDIRLLGELCAADQVALETVSPVMRDGQPVSSSRLRAMIAGGRVREAAEMLTAAYRVSGNVIEGARRGQAIGFPTANLSAIATLLPAPGVYAARAAVAASESTAAGAVWPAAVHIGPNISFGETAVSVEVHLIGFTGNLYGCVLNVDFLDRVRDTQKFASTEELTLQLAKDVRRASQIVQEPCHASGEAV
ncbi:MAG: bifunctional riboflavin kinase/FAD synthetase [Planctomycetia bacterium]|nr:bifunctional riboflavin kinase/FAD synthetase [Planctomycetia bacterium]